ncbi:MAG: hypothetical protein J6U58_03030 [Bacteroidaceae bacterium]|nr:hypothetical protein [Bacteroidaceae bacterium]
MNKRFFFTFVILLMCTALHAQKERLIIHRFTKTPQVKESDYITVRNMVISAFDETGRFDIFDAKQQRLVNIEEQLRESSNAIYDINPNIGDIKTKANKFALEGTVSICEVTKQNYEQGTSYACILVYTISIIDLEENTTVVTETFKHTPPAIGKPLEGLSSTLGLLAGRASGEANTPEKAKNNVFKHIEKDIKRLVKERFPLHGKIFAEDFTVNKDKITDCFINLGGVHGVNVGDKFVIVESITKVGVVVVEEIGELKVETVHKEIAECKVTKGGKEVMKAMERYMEYLDSDAENAYPLRIIIKK